MATVEEVLNVARSQLGYSRWDDPNPGTIYGRWYAEMSGDPYYGVSGVPFCAMFVSWVFAQAGQEAPCLPGAYCPWMVNDTRRAGAEVSFWEAQPGDIIFFDWNGDGESDHVGIVEANFGDWLQTIEGNVDNGEVKRCARDQYTVICICRPNWSYNTTPSQETNGRVWDVSKGIDIYNGEGDAGMRGDETDAGFVICKVSEGTTFQDRYAAQFATNVAAAGKLLGFYHFARQNDAIAEADFFVKCAEETGWLSSATMWLDYESTALNNGPEWCKVFVDRVNELTGKRCGIYTSQSVVNSQDFSNIAWYTPLWLAQYASNDMIYGWQENPWSQKPYGAWGDYCSIHQYGGGYVDGWPYALDLDRGYFTVDQWNAWASDQNGSANAEDPAEVHPAPEIYPVDVDGWIGPSTVAEWQRQLGTYVDGVISGQHPNNQKYLSRLWSVTWDQTGSAMVRALQNVLGVTADGFMGKQTVKALQRFLGVTADGYLGPETAIAIQNSINAGVWL